MPTSGIPATMTSGRDQSDLSKKLSQFPPIRAQAQDRLHLTNHRLEKLKTCVPLPLGDH